MGNILLTNNNLTGNIPVEIELDDDKIIMYLKDYYNNYKTYVFLGNGECNEGSVWEAVMSAVNFKLDNLTVIVDNNGFLFCF